MAIKYNSYRSTQTQMGVEPSTSHTKEASMYHNSYVSQNRRTPFKKAMKGLNVIFLGTSFGAIVSYTVLATGMSMFVDYFSVEFYAIPYFIYALALYSSVFFLMMKFVSKILTGNDFMLFILFFSVGFLGLQVSIFLT